MRATGSASPTSTAISVRTATGTSCRGIAPTSVAFERICQELSGKPDFALPYWNWTADRQFPAAFAAGDRNSNPLFHPRPGVANGLRLADDMVGPAVMSAHHEQSGFRGFRQHAAARPEQRRRVMAAPARLHDRAGVQSAQRRASGDRRQHVGGRAVGARSDLLPASRQRRPAVDRLEPARQRQQPGADVAQFRLQREFHRSATVRPGTSASASSVRRRRSATATTTMTARSPPISCMPTGDLMTEKLHAYRRMDLARDRCGQRRGSAPDRAAVRRRDLCRGCRERPGRIARPADRHFGAARPSARRHRRTAGARVSPGPAGCQEVPALCLGGAARHRAAARRHHPRAGVRQLPRALAAHAARTIRATRRASAFSAASTPATAAAADRSAGRRRSVYVDLTQALARLDHPRSLRADRLTVQLLPHCSNSEANVSNIRPRRVEVVIL